MDSHTIIARAITLPVARAVIPKLHSNIHVITYTICVYT